MTRKAQGEEERREEDRILRGRRTWPEDDGTPREAIVFEEPASSEEWGWTGGTGEASQQEVEEAQACIEVVWLKRQAHGHE